ncbi:MAG: radical SAM protein [Desulfurococcaceae archaeon TW002]
MSYVLEISKCNDLGCWIGRLPRGCDLCIKGLKSVFFVTGVCNEKCFYCPISSYRRGMTDAYINEVLVSRENDIILEVLASGSRGVGITGGDPLLTIDNVIKVLRTLKEVLGGSFHIHMYTTGRNLKTEYLDRLSNAGLDELRIHVTGPHSWIALKHALDYDFDVGIENPAIPDFNKLRDLIEEGYKLGVHFINLNEMEVSESNYAGILSKGFKVNPDGLTVRGSREAALQAMNWVLEKGLTINIHYCPARFKDKYQYRRRLIKRFKKTRLPYETLSREGVVKWVEAPYKDDQLINYLVLSGLALKKGEVIYSSIRLFKKLKNVIPADQQIKVVEAYPTNPRKLLNILHY